MTDKDAERVVTIAEPLFADAVAQGLNAPFGLDADYWGRQYGERLDEALREAGLVP